MNSYEIEQLKEITAWEKEEPSVVSKAVGFVFKPITWIVNKIIPQKAIEGVLMTCDKVAELVTDSNDIKRDASVNNISELAYKDLELSDKLANEVHNWAVAIAGTEGGIAGFWGLPGMIVDVPTLITMGLRVIHKIGLCYGFECKTEQDKQLVMGILSAAGANTVQEKAVSIAVLQRINVLVAKNTWKAITAKAATNKYGVEATVIAIKMLAKQLGINISKRKALQAIPYIGAGVGLAMNAAYINDIAWATRRTFQKRWLMSNREGIEYAEI